MWQFRGADIHDAGYSTRGVGGRSFAGLKSHEPFSLSSVVFAIAYFDVPANDFWGHLFFNLSKTDILSSCISP